VGMRKSDGGSVGLPSAQPLAIAGQVRYVSP
jgi:hypothetical protein